LDALLGELGVPPLDWRSTQGVDAIEPLRAALEALKADASAKLPR